MTEAEEKWDVVIKARSKSLSLPVGELLRYRDLIFLFVNRDFISVYKQTILGPLWYVLKPLLTTLVYAFIFSRVARLSTEGLPPLVFYMLGIVSWSYFAECLNKTSDTFIANQQIFGKVYFPRLVIPISIVISNLISFFVQLLVFALLTIWAYYFSENGHNIKPSIYVLMTPVFVVLMAAIGLGTGIIISSLTTKYRDLKFLVSFAVQLLMYMSPVIFPLSTVTGTWKTILLLNPLTPIIEGFRFAFLGAGTFDWSLLSYSAVFALCALIGGMLIFSKVEKNFMDTV